MAARYTRQMKQQLSQVVDVQSLLMQIEELKSENEKLKSENSFRKDATRKLLLENQELTKEKNALKKISEEQLLEITKWKNKNILLDQKVQALQLEQEQMKSVEQPTQPSEAGDANAEMAEAASSQESNEADVVRFDVKFNSNFRIRKKKFSLMLRDLINSAFTPDELGECTLSGRSSHKQLDPVRLEGVKKKLKERFPTMADSNFRRLVSNCLRDAKNRRK